MTTAGQVASSATFARPPVIEVALAFEFQPVAEIGVVQLARLADLWSDEYPSVEEQPPLPTNPPVGLPGQLPAMFVTIGAPSIRLWLVGQDGSQLLQVQRDRLILNWRRLDSHHDYPRYQVLRPKFLAAVTRMLDFVAQQTSGTIHPSAVEVSYVNEIPVSSDSAELRLETALRTLNVVPGRLEGPVLTQTSQSFPATSPYNLPATLFVASNSVGRGPNAAQLTLNYRAAVSPDAVVDQIMHTVDVGHADVVSSFAALATDEARQVWGWEQG